MLTGAELLAKVHELGDCPKDQLVLTCGYKTPAGKPAYTVFYEALLQAKGVALAPPSTARKASRGKAPSFKATVAKTGTVPVGAAYTSLIGAKAGDTITIGHEGSRLWLEVSATGEALGSASEAAEASPASGAAAGAPAAALAPF